MLLHSHTRLSRIMRANSPVNLAVHLRRFLEIYSIYNCFAAVLIQISGDRLHQRAPQLTQRQWTPAKDAPQTSATEGNQAVLRAQIASWNQAQAARRRRTY